MQATNAIAIWSAILFLLGAASGATAEPVSVNRGEGLGFLFSYGGNCYVVLPEHVHGRRRSLSLRTAAPSAFGEARLFKSFLPGADLSIGIVTGGATERCRERWEDLPARTDALLDRHAEATLVRVASTGAEERLPMRIIDRTFESLTAELTPDVPDAKIYKGTSGAILRIGDTVVGMATNAPNDRQARFLRIDEMKSLLARLIESRFEQPQGAAAGREASSPAEGGATAGLCEGKGAVPLRSVTCNAEPTEPENGCGNLVGTTGPAILPPGAGIDLVAELDTADARPVDSVLIGKNEADEASAAPKSVLVEVDSSENGAPRWRRFGSRDMTPFGRAAITNGSRPFAKRVRVRILTSWDAAKPIRVDCLTVVSAQTGVSR